MHHVSRTAREEASRPLPGEGGTTGPAFVATGAGAESRQQIGWVIVGGMSLGTLLTIFVVPTMYTLFARKEVPGANKAPVRDDAAPHGDLIAK